MSPIIKHPWRGLTVVPLAFSLLFSVTQKAMASATIAFLTPTVFTLPVNGYIKAMDVDGDGHIDILIPSGSNLIVKYGHGDGTFDTLTYPAGTSDLSRVAVADLNGDGRNDIVYSNYNGNTLSVYLATGTRTFAARVPYTVAYAPGGMAIADFNEDGKLDIAVGNNHSSNMAVLLNKGGGTFAPAVFYGTGDYPINAVALDQNGDGHLDLVVSKHYAIDAPVFYGDGKGNFTPQIFAPVGGGDLLTADLNNDGILDLAGNDYWGGTMGIALSNGIGAFPVTHRYSTSGNPSVITEGDLNGDGYTDIAIGHQGSNAFTTWTNDGTGAMVLPYVTFTTVGTDVHEAAIADINEDGQPDAIVDDWNGHVSIFYNNTNPAPTIKSLTPNYAIVGGASFSFKVNGFGLLSRSVVKWNGTALTTTFSHGTLVAQVPSSLTTSLGSASITVTTSAPGGGTSSSLPFAIVNASSTGLVSSAPTSTFGQSVTFTAGVTHALGAATPTGSVTFYDGAKSLGTKALGANAIATLSTSTLTAGQHSITASYSGDANYGASTSSPITQTVNTTTITSFTPASGLPGTLVTINGTLLSGATSVTIHGKPVFSYTIVSDTKITATVDAGTTTGPITVVTPVAPATSATSFVVIQTPSITSFGPTSGPVGTTVAILGTGFTGVTAVKFHGTTAEQVTVVNDTRITAKVAVGSTTGQITVTNPAGTGTSTYGYHVIVAPSITSFTTTAGPVGKVITITGTGFDGTTAVAFHGKAATYTIVSTTQIKATVPTGATTGPISVTTPVATANSSTNFRVIPIPTLSSFGPTVGPVGSSVTLHGTGFSDVTSVKFHGTPASFVINNDTLITATIAANTTTGQIVVTSEAGSATSQYGFHISATVAVTNNASTASGFAFAPLTVHSGTSVNWVNQSSAPHCIMWDSRTPSTSPPPGANINVFNAGTTSTAWTAPTVTTSTTYAYHCCIHGGSMSGTIIVIP